ncbi:hypothetical protein R6Q57_000976 [Mikania cordata]
MEGDYRDHNQDDSDSSEHNKSVQVELEEELVRPKEKKAPAKRWTDEEEVALARSWLTNSENPDVGNAQKRDGFYRKVTDHFQFFNIYSKWNDLNSAMKKCDGFQASMNRKSGERDEQVLKKAMKDYKSGEGDEHVLKKAMKDYKSVVKSKGFPHIQAWELVRYNSL